MFQVYDNFLDNYSELKEYSKSCEFKDIENVVDGVTYPAICDKIPKSIKKELFDKLSQFKGSTIENPTLFMRMSKKGVNVPHIAHTDISMGQYSLMLYLNEHAGTSFLRHLMTGISYQPILESFTTLVAEDINNVDAWVPYQMVESRENRALIFDAACFHRAEPIGGFGETQDDARIVLTCFFS